MNNANQHQRLVEIFRRHARKMQPLPADQSAKLQKLDGIRAVAFDVYGTLAISSSGDIGLTSRDDKASAIEWAALETGIIAAPNGIGKTGARYYEEEVRAAQDRRRAEGIDYPEVEIREVWRAVFQRLHQDGLCESRLDINAIEMFGALFECRMNPTCAMPGLRETLAQLHARGLPLGIVSNAQYYTPPMLEYELRQSHLDAGFDERLCVWSFDARIGKPSVALYETFATRLRTRCALEPEQCLFVGNDMLKDIWAASQAGFHIALFAGDARSLRLRPNDARCRELQPDIVITELRQLLQVV
ncbi:HAD family hydrolase [Candidatus Sumerlaeota bacterium]|nr:HAD family hydrolase [Candidatus Sumerlaeota bacterium]